MIHEYVHGQSDPEALVRAFGHALNPGGGPRLKGIKGLLVRPSNQGMGMMLAGQCTGIRTQWIRSHQGKKEPDLFVRIANIEVEVSGEDVFRIYRPEESYDVFMLGIGNLGRFSVTESSMIDTTNLLDLS